MRLLFFSAQNYRFKVSQKCQILSGLFSNCLLNITPIAHIYISSFEYQFVCMKREVYHLVFLVLLTLSVMSNVLIVMLQRLNCYVSFVKLFCTSVIILNCEL